MRDAVTWTELDCEKRYCRSPALPSIHREIVLRSTETSPFGSTSTCVGTVCKPSVSTRFLPLSVTSMYVCNALRRPTRSAISAAFSRGHARPRWSASACSAGGKATRPLTFRATKLATALYFRASPSRFRQAASPHQQFEYSKAIVGFPAPTTVLSCSGSPVDTSRESPRSGKLGAPSAGKVIPEVSNAPSPRAARLNRVDHRPMFAEVLCVREVSLQLKKLLKSGNKIFHI